jgi:AcrR family transcriptional regulator
MEAVAARAGVSKPTLYLRYPSKQVLIFDAVFGKTKALDMPETGSLRGDLLEAYGWAVAEFAAPEARATLPAMLAEMPTSPEFVRLVRAEVIDPEYARVQSLLLQAQARGEIRDGADLTLVIDAFLGAALARAVLLDRPLDHDFAHGMVDLLIEGLRPRPTAE